jgi:hypothetical protein
MKANEAPEKIYLNQDDGLIWHCRSYKDDIEYTRTDAFIEKAWDWIEDNVLSSNQQDKSRLYCEQFKNYMKGK